MSKRRLEYNKAKIGRPANRQSVQSCLDDWGRVDAQREDVGVANNKDTQAASPDLLMPIDKYALITVYEEKLEDTRNMEELLFNLME